MSEDTAASEVPSEEPSRQLGLQRLMADASQDRVVELARTKPAALLLAILADEGGRANTATIKRAASAVVRGSVNTWWEAAKSQGRGGGWVHFQPPDRWRVVRWPKVSSLEDFDPGLVLPSLGPVVQSRPVTEPEEQVLDQIAELTGMSKQERRWAQQRVEGSRAALDRGDLLAWLLAQDALSKRMTSIVDSDWCTDLHMGAVRLLRKLARAEGDVRSEEKTLSGPDRSLEHMTILARNLRELTTQSGFPEVANREVYIGGLLETFCVLSTGPFRRTAVVRDVRWILAHAFEQATDFLPIADAADAGRLPPGALGKLLKETTDADKLTIEEIIEYVGRERNARLLRRIVEALPGGMERSAEHAAKALTDALAREPLTRSVTELLRDVPPDAASQFSPGGIPSVLFVTEPQGSALFARWLISQLSAANGSSSPLANTITRLIAEQTQRATDDYEQARRAAEEERDKAIEERDRAQRGRDEAEARLRELQASTSATQGTQRLVDRIPLLAAIAALADQLAKFDLPADRRLRLQAILAQFGIERVGTSGETTAANAAHFDVIGDYVEDGSPATVLEPAWIYRAPEGDQVLSRGAVRAVRVTHD